MLFLFACRSKMEQTIDASNIRRILLALCVTLSILKPLPEVLLRLVAACSYCSRRRNKHSAAAVLGLNRKDCYNPVG